MAEKVDKLDDMESIREELNTQLSLIERRALEVVRAEANNTMTAEVDTDDEMDVSITDYSARILVIEKETHDLCQRMSELLVADGPDFPKSRVHALHSLIQSLATEIKSKKLMKMKSIQKKKALQNKIAYLEVQSASLEEALQGIKKTIEEVEDENKKAVDLLGKVKEEFAASRKDLHDVLEKLFPDDDGHMKYLLADLTKARFSGDEEKWVDISEHFFSHVELLLGLGIIENKPDNPHLAAFTF